MKTMQALKRVLAVCLIAVFALQPGSLAVAETASGTGIVSSGTAQKLPAEEITLLRADELPENVSYAEAVEKQFVERMHDEEPNLHTVVLRHADNTRTMIVENHPVKYVDSTGKIQDKSLKIERNPNASKTEYRTKSNDVQTTFAGTLSGGIRLQHDGVDIRMTPYTADSGKVTTSPSAVLSSDSKRITYALNEKVRYDYSLTYMGFKEDIVLTEYTGQTDFVFTLHTNGLHPVQMDGSWFLCDDTEAIRATIGDIIIFTADERNNAFGSLTVEAITENQEYRMTIHVDDDYLTDEKTVYPIRIDPTIEVNSSSGTRAIEDITLNSTALCAPGSASVFVGNRQNYGISRLLMKFPGLTLDPDYSIIAATVEIRDLMCESTAMSISVHRFTGNTWSETDSNWSSPADWSKVNPNSYIATPMDTKTVSYSNGTVLTSPHRYPFDITSAVQLWVTDENAQNKGIIFKCPNTLEGSSTYQTKTFASFNRSAYQPSIKVTYTTTPNSYVQIKEESISVKTGTTASLTWGASGSVIWTSSNNSVATVNNDVDNSGIVIVTAKSVGTTTIKASLASDADIYDVCRVTVTEDSVAITKTSTTLNINGSEKLDCKATGPVSWVSSNDRVAKVKEGVVTAYACGQVTITATLNSNSEVKDSCTVIVAPSSQNTIINGIYRIKNVATSQYLTVDKHGNLIMDSKDTDTMGKLSQWWYIQKEDDNYYTIESLSLKGITDDGMYQKILSATTAYCTISSNQSIEPIEKWDITAFQNGYVLTSGHNLEKKLICNQTMVTMDTDESSNILWQLEYEFMGTSFTFDGEYTTYYDTDTGPLIVNVIYDEKVRNCMSDEDFCSVENCWNNLGMNIQVNVIYIPEIDDPYIQRSGITLPYAHITAVVRLVNFEDYTTPILKDINEAHNPDAVARTICYADGQWLKDKDKYNHKDQTWDSTIEIQLNKDKFKTLTPEQCTRTLIHEVGHVLKLKHPHNVVDGYVPNSIMCQQGSFNPEGTPQDDMRPIVLRPTGYDKAILMAKWGEKDE